MAHASRSSSSTFSVRAAYSQGRHRERFSQISRADVVLCNLDAGKAMAVLTVEQSLREGCAIPS
jgi:hypothetical protein